MTQAKDILNWQRVDARMTTSGQPTEAEIAQLAADGVATIVNLGPHSNKGALPDETATVAALGMRYVYIPVDFGAPTEADFAAFCVALTGADDGATHVHCIYNARVSAFFYRYALDGLGGDLDEACARMDRIWRPGGVWATFVRKPEDADLPNRYKGDDY